MKRKYGDAKLNPTNMLKTCLLRKETKLPCMSCPYSSYCEGKEIGRPIRKGVDLYAKFTRI